MWPRHWSSPAPVRPPEANRPAHSRGPAQESAEHIDGIASEWAGRPGRVHGPPRPPRPPSRHSTPLFWAPRARPPAHRGTGPPCPRAGRSFPCAGRLWGLCGVARPGRGPRLFLLGCMPPSRGQEVQELAATRAGRRRRAESRQRLRLVAGPGLGGGSSSSLPAGELQAQRW